MLIKEQMRKYKVKMEEITQLEAAESMAFRRLSLLRQNAVSYTGRCLGGAEQGLGGGRGLACLPSAHFQHTSLATISLTWGLVAAWLGADSVPWPKDPRPSPASRSAVPLSSGREACHLLGRALGHSPATTLAD